MKEANQIVMRDLSELAPYENNSRVHSDYQIQMLVGSINEYGFTAPLLIDENDTILAGHGRFEAAELCGLNRVPCVVLSHLSEEQKRAYVIADNKITLAGSWDTEKLISEIENLSAHDFDVSLTGFTDEEIASLSIPDYSPGTAEDQGQLDTLDPKWITCPNCHDRFDARSQE